MIISYCVRMQRFFSRAIQLASRNFPTMKQSTMLEKSTNMRRVATEICFSFNSIIRGSLSRLLIFAEVKVKPRRTLQVYSCTYMGGWRISLRVRRADIHETINLTVSDWKKDFCRGRDENKTFHNFFFFQVYCHKFLLLKTIKDTT